MRWKKVILTDSHNSQNGADYERSSYAGCSHDSSLHLGVVHETMVNLPANDNHNLSITKNVAEEEGDSDRKESLTFRPARELRR